MTFLTIFKVLTKKTMMGKKISKFVCVCVCVCVCRSPLDTENFISAPAATSDNQTSKKRICANTKSSLECFLGYCFEFKHCLKINLFKGHIEYSMEEDADRLIKENCVAMAAAGASSAGMKSRNVS